MNDDPAPRRGRRTLRIALIVVLVALVVIVGAAAAFIASFDLNKEKGRIVAAVKQATGRDIALNGPIGLKWSLLPTIEMRDVALANPPGFSRPAMATFERLELRLALFPLLVRRVDIDRLVLVHPDIRLETDPHGQPNWQFTPARTEAPPGAAPAAPGEPGSRYVVSLRDVRIQDGTIAYRDGATGKMTVLGVRQLTAAAASADAPLRVTGNASYGSVAFTLTAETGSLARLQDPSATTPWPVKLALSAGSARFGAEGALTQPLRGKGYTLAVTGDIPDLTALSPLAPGVRLPPLRDVRLSATVADRGQAIPALSQLALHAGATDLGADWVGLRLDRLDVTAPALDQPLKAAAAGRIGDAPLTLAATLGKPALLLPGARAPEPFPIDIAIKAAGADLTAKGRIADPAALSGVSIGLAATIPDLAALSPLARRPLPAVKSIAFQGTVTDVPGGLAKGVTLRGAHLTMPEADVAGDLSLALGSPPGVTANVTARRIDLDALRAAAGAAPPPQPGTPAPAAAAPPQPTAKSGRLFSDQPIPFSLLRLANADVRLALDLLRAGGAEYKAVETHLVLQGGRLRIDPFKATLPEGPLDAKLAVDGGQQAPPVSVTLHAPGLALRPLLAALGQPAYATGTAEVQADLRGAGDSPHAIAASLDGTLAVTMAGGTIDNRLLGGVLGKVLDKVNLLDLVGRGETSQIRCVALRLQARDGIATVHPLVLSSSLLTMDGGGTVNLRDETLALTLRPQGRVGGTGLVVPLKATGPIRSPSVELDPAGVAESNAGAVAGAVLGNATPLGIIGGLLGGEKLLTGGSNGGESCATALALARGQPAPAASAPAPGASPPPTRTAPPKAPDPATLLRQLFR